MPGAPRNIPPYRPRRPTAALNPTTFASRTARLIPLPSSLAPGVGLVLGQNTAISHHLQIADLLITSQEASDVLVYLSDVDPEGQALQNRSSGDSGRQGGSLILHCAECRDLLLDGARDDTLWPGKREPRNELPWNR